MTLQESQSDSQAVAAITFAAPNATELELAFLDGLEPFEASADLLSEIGDAQSSEGV